MGKTSAYLFSLLMLIFALSACSSGARGRNIASIESGAKSCHYFLKSEKIQFYSYFGQRTEQFVVDASFSFSHGESEKEIAKKVYVHKSKNLGDYISLNSKALPVEVSEDLSFDLMAQLKVRNGPPIYQGVKVLNLKNSSKGWQILPEKEREDALDEYLDISFEERGRFSFWGKVFRLCESERLLGIRDEMAQMYTQSEFFESKKMVQIGFLGNTEVMGQDILFGDPSSKVIPLGYKPLFGNAERNIWVNKEKFLTRKRKKIRWDEGEVVRVRMRGIGKVNFVLIASPKKLDAFIKKVQKYLDPNAITIFVGDLEAANQRNIATAENQGASFLNYLKLYNEFYFYDPNLSHGKKKFNHLLWFAPPKKSELIILKENDNYSVGIAK